MHFFHHAERLLKRSTSWCTIGCLLLAPFCLAVEGVSAQSNEDYVLGIDKRLEIKVHVLGEVARPGEYRVADDTNVLELISKAGGPTEFANVGQVIVKRQSGTHSYTTDEGRDVEVPTAQRVVRVNLDAYLMDDTSDPLPVLEPGDVISVPRNSMHRWKTVFGMVRDLSVIASAYFLYVRSTK